MLGVDIFPEYVQKINEKAVSFNEPKYDELLKSAANLKATTDLQAGLNHSNIIFIFVQTPNGGGSRFYDHSILSNLLEKINKLQPKNKHLIIGCTVMPKYIESVGKMIISNCEECSLSYNPNFVTRGDIIRGFKNPDIILLGTESEEVKPILNTLYDKMVLNNPKYCFMTPTEAEIVKISLNGFITTKISFANMISDLCDSLTDVNKETVLSAIGSDSSVGTKYFQPGMSFGGPYLPRDTKALKQFMDQNGIMSNLLTATSEYNEEHIRFQTELLLFGNEEQIHNMKEVLKCFAIISDKTYYMFDNVCYKENSKLPIIEESAKLKIAELLVKKYGKSVIIRDIEPIINEVKNKYGKLFDYISVPNIS